MIRLKDLLNEGFTESQKKKVADIVKKCFDDKDNKGVRDYKTLNDYLGKLNFEVDAADIEIGGWTPNSYDRSVKYAEIKLQGKTIGYLQHFG